MSFYFIRNIKNKCILFTSLFCSYNFFSKIFIIGSLVNSFHYNYYNFIKMALGDLFPLNPSLITPLVQDMIVHMKMYEN